MDARNTTTEKGQQAASSPEERQSHCNKMFKLAEYDSNKTSLDGSITDMLKDGTFISTFGSIYH